MKEYDSVVNLYNPLRRLENFPLDANALFESYVEALEYARGGSRDDDYTTSAYLGQIISVVQDDESGNTVVKVYKIVVEVPATGTEKEIWGLALIGEGGGGGDGKVKDVQFNGYSFLNDVTGIANFPSDEIGVENGKLKILKIKNEQITIQ